MEDVSGFFKSGFLSLHKNVVGKNYQQKTLKDRMSNFNNLRRETRSTLMFQKRQIDENMTPINTPDSSKFVKQFAEEEKGKMVNKRLEMLKKWKAEKEKKKLEDKLKSKPLFKVCHIPVEVGLPNLENVNNEIKGKPIRSNLKPVKSQFAPPNHKFRAPKNIKPINISSSRNNATLPSTSKTSQRNVKQNSMDSRVKQKASELQTQNNKLLENQNTLKPSRSKTMEKKTNDKSQCSTTNKKVATPKKILPQRPVSPKIQNKHTTETKHNKLLGNGEKSSQKSTISTRSKKIESKHNSEEIMNIKYNPPKKTRRNSKNVERNEEREMKTNDAKNKSISRSRNTPKKSIKNKNFEKVEEMPLDEKEILSDNLIEKQRRREENALLKTPKKTKKSINTPKKGVGWDVVEIIESDDEVFANEITKLPEKVSKKYNKTPRRGCRSKISDDTETEHIKHLTDKDDDMESPFTPKKERTLKKRKSLLVQQKDFLSEHMEKERSESDTDIKSRSSTVGSATGSASPDYPIECIEDNRNLNITSQSSHTPIKNPERETSPVYISPFVTVSRGKSSARKEYQIRHSVGSSITSTPELSKNISENISPKAGADYFAKKLNNEILRIETLCNEWNRYRDENAIPEEASDIINVTIGQSKLLISKKFQQFRSLIEQCKSSDYLEKPVTCEDLHGFWDMTYMQVNDLDKRFNNLNMLKMNNWQEVVPEKKPVIKRGRGRPKKASASSKLKSLINAARNIKKMDIENNLLVPETGETKIFKGGYYSIKSPIKEQTAPIISTNSARRSLRVSLLTNQAKNRLSSSPGLTMMKVSQAIKLGDGITPSKSILKNDLSKSSSRQITKSVLFKDYVDEDVVEAHNSTETFKEDKENDLNEANLIMFSPRTPTRRSQRLNKVT